jgi:hypothetical protein
MYIMGRLQKLLSNFRIIQGTVSVIKEELDYIEENLKNYTDILAKRKDSNLIQLFRIRIRSLTNCSGSTTQAVCLDTVSSTKN